MKPNLIHSLYSNAMSVVSLLQGKDKVSKQADIALRQLSSSVASIKWELQSGLLVNKDREREWDIDLFDVSSPINKRIVLEIREPVPEYRFPLVVDYKEIHMIYRFLYEVDGSFVYEFSHLEFWEGEGSK